MRALKNKSAIREIYISVRSSTKVPKSLRHVLRPIGMDRCVDGPRTDHNKSKWRTQMRNDSGRYWRIRSSNYDKLYWAKDGDYLDAIVETAHFTRNDLVLDVGTGTGVVTEKIKPLVKHIIALDISSSMLEKGRWNGVSIVKWDIRANPFADNLFDKITARMVFHHILNDLNEAIRQCHRALKAGGKLIIAEGVPPSYSRKVVDWYSSMFALKEDRRTFTEKQLVSYLRTNGFRNIQTTVYMMDNFSIKNWLKNSGLSKGRQCRIMQIHTSADKTIKDAYQMKIKGDDCLVRTKNLIITAEK